MAYETIIVEVEDHVALIKLNRPDALNALNDTLLSELAGALTEAEMREVLAYIKSTWPDRVIAIHDRINVEAGG